MKTANEDQQTTLINLGILPPPTETGCRNLLAFLGIRWRCMTKSERVELVKLAQKKWIGASVVPKTDRKVCTIDRIIAKSERELCIHIRSGSDKTNSPFLYHVIGPNGEGMGYKSLGSLMNIDGTEIPYTVTEIGF